MFKIFVNNAVLTKNTYENADFSTCVRKLSNLQFSFDAWLEFDMKPVENDNICCTFVDEEEVVNTILALLDEIDLQLKTIDWLLVKMKWNTRFCETQERRRKNLEYFDSVVMEYLEYSYHTLIKNC